MELCIEWSVPRLRRGSDDVGWWLQQVADCAVHRCTPAVRRVGEESVHAEFDERGAARVLINNGRN
jgi:hypothetical protein